MDAPSLPQYTGQPGTGVPEEYRQLAFEAWAFKFGQNAAAVQRWLSEEHGLTVTKQVVAKWAREGEWAARARDHLQQLAPNTMEQTLAELIFGGLEASRLLRGIVNGTEGAITKTVLQADGTPVEKVVVDAKTRVTAAIAILDRGGFSPVGHNDKASALGNRDASDFLRWFTQDDIQRLLAGEVTESVQSAFNPLVAAGGLKPIDR